MFDCGTCEYSKECAIDATRTDHDQSVFVRGLGSVCKKEEEFFEEFKETWMKGEKKDEKNISGSGYAE